MASSSFDAQNHSAHRPDPNDLAVTPEPTEPGLALSVEAAHRVNFASAQNAVPVIRGLKIANRSEQVCDTLAIHVSATPPLIRPKTWRLDRLGPGAEIQVSDLGIELDLDGLAGLDETELGGLRFVVEQGGVPVLETRHQIEFLARDQWGGLADMDRLLAAYVAPNDAAVAAILKDASRLLAQAGHDDALEGYQSGKPQRAYMIAGAIWSAATGLGLTYAHPPASFERDGQKVRFPSRIRTEGLATCLDTSLLLAAAWEQAGLNPVVLFANGHAWAGVWITPTDFGRVTEPDVVAVRKASQAREFIPVETTYLTKRPTIGFEQAVEAGRARLSEDREDEFQAAIDIKRARAARIRPLASHIAAPDSDAEPVEAAPAALPTPIDLGLLPSEIADLTPATPQGRIERWQGKLLDLSLRNRLLNFRDTSQSILCMVPDVGALEDALANGAAFQMFPLKDQDPIGDRQVEDLDRKQIIADTVRDAFAHRQITVPLSQADMDSRLLTLHRKAKSDMQEGGTNTLFLAAGFLRWKREGEPRVYRAPLLLIPVKLTRRSARSPFQVEHHEDDVRFNATLLEFLKRDFDITIPQLDGDLPRDDSGIDVPLILETVRTRVRQVEGFEVTDDLAISTFSFAKYLMWKDLVDRTDDLRTNRLVAHLVDNPTEAYSGRHGERIDPRDIDRKLDPVDLLTPLPADSSQLGAVVAAMQGRDFVLIGPPGTGKSQTIANIIAQCLAHGKTVLFVAEKAAALDVVQRRLHAHGLGDAVLELHSNKTDRKRVLDQLGRSWDRAARTDAHTWIEINDRLKLSRDQLNAYVAEVHAVGRQGMSVYTAIGWVSRCPDGVAVWFADKDAHDAASFARMEQLADDLGRTWAAASAGPPLDYVAATDWSYAWEGQFLEAAKTLRARLDGVLSAGAALGRRLALTPDGGLSEDRVRLLDTLAARALPEAEDLSRVPDLPSGALRDAVVAFTDDLVGLAAAKARLGAGYRDEDIPRIPLDAFDLRMREAATSFWPISRMKRGKAQKLLQTYAASGTADPERDLAPLRALQRHLAGLASNPLAALAGTERSAPRLERMVAQAIALRAGLSQAAQVLDDAVAFGAVSAELVAGPSGPLRDALRTWQEAAAGYTASRDGFVAAGGRLPEGARLGDMMRGVDEVLAQRSRLADWMRWLETRQAADAAGLAPLADALQAGQVIPNPVAAFRGAYARWWLPLALDASERLRRFLHWEHEDLIRTFRAVDTAAADQASAEIMRRIAHGLPARDDVPRQSELGILRHQLGLQRPSMPIRSLLEHMPESLPKLAPCVLMSPLSVAQYLPAGQPAYDLVIFDEASQITTWDAIGAIARARQSIVVGDPKQLPPTNFFGRNDDDQGEDEGLGFVNKDMPSILDEVSAAGIPTRRLNWHYRSRDEALIAFSNHHYYDGGLVTFPSPTTASDALRFHKVNGVYARGSGRHNTEEARAIADLVRQRLCDWLALDESDRPTLGVITFNQQQQVVIQDLLDDMRRNRPELEWFFADEREEPVIVKNLENIQGDERDVMVFSITFGPDLAGKLTMNFGALNADGGEKRLNVAVTRARREMHVFASLTHDQIDLSRTHAKGVKDLKTFLDYAERGPVALAARDEGSLGPADSPFEAAVAEAFRAKGWEVRTQIGVSGFRIDLGVVHPDRGGVYLAGIECDGAAYHSSATARDRDKVRQAVLEGLGWSILRIWSTEWFRTPKAVVERLHGELERLLAADRARRAEDAARVAMDPPASPPEAPRALPAPEQAAATPRAPDPSPPPTPAPLYAAAVAAPQTPAPSAATALDPARFYEAAYLPTLEALVREIVETEGPLPLARLAREVAQRHGWQRTGARILAQVEQALHVVDRHDEFGQVVLWTHQGYRDRAVFRGLGDRTIQDVSRTEIATVLDTLGPDPITEDEAMQRAKEALGILRLSQSAREYIQKCDAWRLGRADGETGSQ